MNNNQLQQIGNGTLIPMLGLGTWQLTGSLCQETIEKALEVGYRLIDTADIYANHRDISNAITSSKIDRKEIFITSKVWHSNLKKVDLIDSLSRNLDELQTDYLDLYLIHWPNKNIPLAETLDGLLEAKEKRLIREFGVSNFTLHHLEDAIKITKEIAVNQVEFHPSLNQKELKEFCDKHSIAIEAYSPMAQGHDLELEEVVEISKRNNISKAQVIISWLKGKGIITLSKASSIEMLTENFNAMTINLPSKDIESLNNIKSQFRSLTPPINEFDY